MEDHIRGHLVDATHEPGPERAEDATKLVKAVRTYLKGRRACQR